MSLPDFDAFKRSLSIEMQFDPAILRNILIATELSHRPRDEIAAMDARVRLNAEAISDLSILRDEIKLAQKKARHRLSKLGNTVPKAPQRPHLAIAHSIQDHKFGHLTAIALFEPDLDIPSHIPLLIHKGKWRCKCDCGRIVYRKTDTLDRHARGVATLRDWCSTECDFHPKNAKPKRSPLLTQSAINAFAAVTASAKPKETEAHNAHTAHESRHSNVCDNETGNNGTTHGDSND